MFNPALAHYEVTETGDYPHGTEVIIDLIVGGRNATLDLLDERQLETRAITRFTSFTAFFSHN